MNRKSPSHRYKNQRRSGYVLVLVATLLFGLFAMAALVIDLGFARVAQRQMQTAADAAALEGLRGEGIEVYEDRQEAAKQLITWTFDDDLDATNGTAGVLGAGPNLTFSGGVGDPGLNASQFMAIDPDATSYQPVVQQRTDSLESNEFSIAIQRGGNVNREFDLLAEGPAVPYLFARGSLMDRERAGTGMATGGVARAITDRALRVGLPVNDTANQQIYPGAVAIGYTLADWNGSRSDPRQMDSPKTMVGQKVKVVGAATLVDGYCCIFASIDGDDLVIGFGRIQDSAALPSSVAVANAAGRRGSVWNQIDAAVRQDVLTQNETIVGGLLVARLSPGT